MWLNWSEVQPVAKTSMYDFASLNTEAAYVGIPNRWRTAVTPRNGDPMEPDIRTALLLRVPELSDNLDALLWCSYSCVDKNRPQTGTKQFGFLLLVRKAHWKRIRGTRSRVTFAPNTLSHRTWTALTHELIFVTQLKYLVSKMMNPRSRKCTINWEIIFQVKDIFK